MKGQQIIVQSTNINDTPVDIEEKLEKALTAITLQRENKQFRDKILKKKKTDADRIVRAVFQSMIGEISAVLKTD